MRCDDADVMMTQKEKQTNSNLGENPGTLQPCGLREEKPQDCPELILLPWLISSIWSIQVYRNVSESMLL